MFKVRRNNKGFTLVELIVVIVILAILIGVTIGGIYKYVGQSRYNTDENNRSSLQSTLSTIATEQDMYDLIQTESALGGVKNGTFDLSVSHVLMWKDAITATDTQTLSEVLISKMPSISSSSPNLTKVFANHIVELCPDGLPKLNKGV